MVRNVTFAVLTITILSMAFAANKVVDKNNVKAKVVKIYDGDTFYVNIEGWPDICGKKMPVRIYGIDCPEMKSKNEDEKINANHSKDFLQQLIQNNNNEVILFNLRRDKYFRILSDVKIGDIDVAKELLAKKLAREYLGGHKEDWDFKD